MSSTVHIKTAELAALLCEKPLESQEHTLAATNPDFLQTLHAMYSNPQVWRVDRRMELVQKFIRKASITPEDLSALYFFNHQKAIEYIRKICELDLDEFETKRNRPYELIDFMDKLLSTRRKKILQTHLEIHHHLHKLLLSNPAAGDTALGRPVEQDQARPEAVEGEHVSPPARAERRMRALPAFRFFTRPAIMVGVSALILITTLVFRGELNGYFSAEEAAEIRTASLSPRLVPGLTEIDESQENQPTIESSPQVAPEPEKPSAGNPGQPHKNMAGSPQEKNQTLSDIPENDDETTLPSYHPPASLLPLNLIRGKTDLKKIALTFDGDSRGEDTHQILAILRKYHLSCTFFLTGHFIEHFPEEVLTIVADGHEVGNHTYTHPHLKDISEQELLDQLKRTEHIFQETTGKRMAPYWRAPYGEYTPRVARIARKLGYLHVHWTHWRGREHSLDTIDWNEDETSKLFFSSDEIVHHILSSPYKSGGIVLLHVGARTVDPLYRKFPLLIEGLQKQSYDLVTVTEIIQDLYPLGLAQLTTTNPPL